jgi:hypothetical protein
MPASPPPPAYTRPPHLPPRTAPAAAALPVSRPPPASAKPAAAKAPVKTFAIAKYQANNEGQKILIYAPTGLGKTTLASMAPNVVYIAFDKNAMKVTNAKTGEAVDMIPGIEGVDDLRNALHQPGLFPDGSTIVIDTITKAEAVSESYIFDHYPIKSGKATNMRAYGWDGPGHLLDVTRLLLTDLEPHVSAGRNVILLAQQGQATISNSAGVDYLQDGPRLSHTKQYSSRMEVSEWCDHVLRIGYQEFEVTLDSDKARVGKAGGSMTRAVFTGGAAHYLAKTRKIGDKTLPPVVSFATPDDDSLWQFIFNGALP